MQRRWSRSSRAYGRNDGGPGAGWEWARQEWREAGGSGVQSCRKDSGFHSKCGGELLEVLGKGITQLDKCFQEITLAAVKKVKCRGKRVGLGSLLRGNCNGLFFFLRTILASKWEINCSCFRRKHTALLADRDCIGQAISTEPSMCGGMAAMCIFWSSWHLASQRWMVTCKEKRYIKGIS